MISPFKGSTFKTFLFTAQLIPGLQSVSKDFAYNFCRIPGLRYVVAVVADFKKHVMGGQILIIAVSSFQNLACKAAVFIRGGPVHLFYKLQVGAVSWNGVADHVGVQGTLFSAYRYCCRLGIRGYGVSVQVDYTFD